ncbi:MAG: DUF4293 family protein [Bacteroidota bacterium]
MWQRFQTLFLALVVILMVASIFFPIWRYDDPTVGARYELYPIHYSITTVSNGGEEQKSTAYFPYSITAILMIAARYRCSTNYSTLRQSSNSNAAHIP